MVFDICYMEKFSKMLPCCIWIFCSFLSSLLSISYAESPPTIFSSHPHSGSPLLPTSTKLLYCAADGSPAPVYRWLKDGRFITQESPDGGTLKIRNIGRSDAGNYQCLASNSLGAILSRTAVVQVAYITPFADTRSSERFVEEGGAAIFDLPAVDCYPAPSIQWYEGSAVSPLRGTENYHVTLRNQLVVLDTKYGVDNGKVWRATATNGYTQQTSDGPTFVLRVQNVNSEVTPRIVIPPTDTIAVQDVDEAVKFECIVNARPPSYVRHRWYWISDAGQTTDLSSSTSGSKYLFSSLYRRVLTIRAPVVNDSGVYRCEATYHKPSTLSSQDITLSAEARLIVHVKPSSSSSDSAPSEQLRYKVESWLTIPCPMTGIPQPTIQWYRNAIAISNSARVYVASNNGSLIINSAVEDDTAVYQCFGTNDAGQTSHAVTLTVFSIAPFFENSPQNQTVVTGNNLRLNCRAGGAPVPTISWSRIRASFGGAAEQLATGEVLTLTNVTLRDTGMYSCTAVNSKGSSTVSAFVRITVRTRIVKTVPTTTAVDGTDVVLSCSVESDMYYRVVWSWYRNSSLIDTSYGSRASVMRNGSLQLRSVSRSDVGVYTCKVESEGGRDTSSGWLQIIEKPSSPWVLSAILSREPRAVDVMWVAERDSVITSFTVYAQPLTEKSYMPASLLHPVIGKLPVNAEINSSLVLTVRNLQPGIRYSFTVTAENEAGESPPSLSNHIVTVPEERPSSAPIVLRVISNASSTAIVCWQPPSESQWNGLLHGYVIHYRLASQKDGAVSTVNLTTANQQCLDISHLNDGEAYEFAVSCYNAIGSGPVSDSSRVIIYDPLLQSAPVNVTAAPINSTAVRVTFVTPYFRRRPGLEYRIFMREINSQTDHKKLPSDYSEEVNLSADLEQTESSSTVIGRGELTSPGMRTEVVTGLKKFTKYRVTVKCFSRNTAGPQSLPVDVQTAEDVPDEVRTLSVDKLAGSVLDVHWTPPAHPNGIISGYMLNYSGDGNNFQVEPFPAYTLSHKIDISSLSARTVYTIYVAALTRIGMGRIKSTTVTVIPLVTSTVRSMPPNVVTSTVGKSKSTWQRVKQSSTVQPSTVIQQNIDSSVSQVNSTATSLGSHMDTLLLSGSEGRQSETLSLLTHWWFFVIIAIVSLLLVSIIVILICWTSRRNNKHKKLKYNGSTLSRRQAADVQQDTLGSLPMDDESGFTTIERRQRWHARNPHANTLPVYTRAPPRPSPGSIQYDGADIELHQMMSSMCDDDSGHASDRALQDIDEDSDGEQNMHTSSLHRSHLGYGETELNRPRSLYDTCPSRHPSAAAYQTLTKNANGQSPLKPAQSSTFRPQPVLSSFT